MKLPFRRTYIKIKKFSSNHVIIDLYEQMQTTYPQRHLVGGQKVFSCHHVEEELKLLIYENHNNR